MSTCRSPSRSAGLTCGNNWVDHLETENVLIDEVEKHRVVQHAQHLRRRRIAAICETSASRATSAYAWRS